MRNPPGCRAVRPHGVQLAVVVAVAFVRMVQMAGDEIVGMVAVRHRLVPAAGSVLVASLMAVTGVVRLRRLAPLRPWWW